MQIPQPPRTTGYLGCDGASARAISQLLIVLTMANLLHFIFVFVPGEISKCILNILISVGLAPRIICYRSNDHLECDDNIRSSFPLIYQINFSCMRCAGRVHKDSDTVSRCAPSPSKSERHKTDL